jgi:hypothetical protein
MSIQLSTIPNSTRLLTIMEIIMEVTLVRMAKLAQTHPLTARKHKLRIRISRIKFNREIWAMGVDLGV